MRLRRTLRFIVVLAMLAPLMALGRPGVTTASAAAGQASSGRAYVTDLFAGTVTVIDITTNTVIDTIPVGASPSDATPSPDGSTVYVSLQEAGAVAVIDTATNTVTNTIPVGILPSGIAFTPDGARAYVVNGQSNDVSVIDTATQTVVATIPLPEGASAISVAVTPDGATAYVTNGGLNTVSVIDTATNTVTADIPVGEAPYGVTVALDGTRAYVTNRVSNDVSVIDTATNTVIATIPVGPNPSGIAASPDGSTVYVASADAFTVSVIDAASNTVTATVPTGAGTLISVAVTNTRVYVTSLAGSLTVIDRAFNVVIASIPIGDPDTFSGFAWGVAVVPADTPPPSATPTITTQASPNNLQGAVVSDTATVSGGANPTGEVIFRLYSDPDCLNEVFTSTNPLVGGTATSDNFGPAPGTYYWRAVYTGDANNNPAATPCGAPDETVVISPFAPPPFTRTITGDTRGGVTVNANESVQIVNARVAGAVTVNPGGSLTVLNSQISQGIVANAPGFLSICGSQLAAPPRSQALGVFDAPVPVRIGDAARGCAGNRIAGQVNLIGNMAVTFANNIVSASVIANDNGPGQTDIRSNNIYRLLACSGNNPPPTATRPQTRNTAGSRSGQCVSIG